MDFDELPPLFEAIIPGFVKLDLNHMIEQHQNSYSNITFDRQYWWFNIPLIVRPRNNDYIFRKLIKLRKRWKSFKIKNWYKLYLLTKTEAFYIWYCAPGNIGNKVDKTRIRYTLTTIINKINN